MRFAVRSAASRVPKSSTNLKFIRNCLFLGVPCIVFIRNRHHSPPKDEQLIPNQSQLYFGGKLSFFQKIFEENLETPIFVAWNVNISSPSDQSLIKLHISCNYLRLWMGKRLPLSIDQSSPIDFPQNLETLGPTLSKVIRRRTNRRENFRIRCDGTQGQFHGGIHSIAERKDEKRGGQNRWRHD